MSREELQRERTWSLVEIALLLLATLLLTMDYRWFGGAVAGLFVFVLLRPDRGTL